MNKISALLNNYETFDDDVDFEYCNKSPDIILLEDEEKEVIQENITTINKPIIEELQELNYNEVEFEINKYHESFNIDYLLMKYQDEMNEKYKEKVNKLPNKNIKLDCIDKITQYYKYSLKKYDNRNLFKITEFDDLEINIYGLFFKMKKDSKIRVEYIYHNGEKHYIKYDGKIIDARRLLWDVFICSSENLELSFKKGNINELRNINFKLR